MIATTDNTAFGENRACSWRASRAPSPCARGLFASLLGSSSEIV
jgi:hypothetical protein